MPQCTACGDNHARPTGRKCTRAPTKEPASPAQNEDPQTAMMRQMMAQINSLSTRMTAFEDRQAAAGPPQFLPPADAQAGAQGPLTSTQPTTANNGDNLTDQDLRSYVERRLRDAALDAEETTTHGTSKLKAKKSGLVRTATDLVQHEIAWPHHFVFRSRDGERVAAAYGHLTIAEFGFGFCTAMKREPNHHTREDMLDYLTALFRDAIGASWATVKDCNAALMHEMEAGQLSWADHDKIRSLRLELMAKAPAFHPREHKKYCGFCFKATGNEYPHPEDRCFRKKKTDRGDRTEQPKNDA